MKTFLAGVVLLLLLVALDFPATPIHATSQPDLRTITLQSPALGKRTTVVVLVPDGYATSARRYPVLYLLHGSGETSSDWSTQTDVSEFARHLPLIVVMPEADDSWYMDPTGPGPRWETYHITELIPYIDAHLRTIATRKGRAVAGLSMGGFGAFAYAARHPDLFVAAASFSGVLALRSYKDDPRGSGAPSMDTPQDLWQVRAHDPVDLAQNLRGLRLFMSAGNGKPGPFEAATGTEVALENIEAGVHATLIKMEAALHTARVPVTVDDYGAGIHNWPYWQRELHRFMPMLLAEFTNPPAPPTHWSYRTADASATVWGYALAVTRPHGVFGFTDLGDVQPQGFTVRGSGTVSVVTSSIYLPGHAYAIRRDQARAARVASDAHGRLHLTVALGGATAMAHIGISPLP